MTEVIILGMICLVLLIEASAFLYFKKVKKTT